MQRTNWQKAAESLSVFFSSGTHETFFKDFQNEFQWNENPRALACACSGGSDSLCALLLLWEMFPSLRKNLFVLHYDHALRKESADDATFVSDVCESLEVKFISERRAEKECPRPQSETEFRRLRLDFFNRTMQEQNIHILVQGHQQDDIAESMLMRFFRGAGTDGLAAPRPISRHANGHIFVRPLLSIPKKEIINALNRCEIPWREDATNSNVDHFRNRIRNRVIPELKRAAPFENFARSRCLAEEDAEALNFFAENVYSSIIEKCDFEKVAQNHIDSARYNLKSPAETLEKYPALTRRVLRKIFTREKFVFNAHTADALVHAITTKTHLQITVSEKKILWDGAGTLVFSKSLIEKSLLKAKIFHFSKWQTGEIFHFSPTTGTVATGEILSLHPTLLKRIFSGEISPEKSVFLSLEEWMSDTISVRAWTFGERIRPLGALGEKTIGDALTDKKVPLSQRKSLPVFADATGVAWIPGVPPANRLRLRGTEKMALRLTYSHEPLTL